MLMVVQEPHFNNLCSTARDSKLFSLNGQKVNILGFVGLSVSDAPLCIYSTKASTDNT